MAFDDMSGDSGAISQINVTPLVDVMLVLLIIFMVAAPILQQGVELELPKETIAPVESGDSEQLIVSITKDGNLFIGSGNAIELELLGPKLVGILSTRQDKRVFIKADHRVTYGQVMAAMARIKRAGIEKVGLLTDPTNS
jgi:biopolymer transport protein TolR